MLFGKQRLLAVKKLPTYSPDRESRPSLVHRVWFLSVYNGLSDIDQWSLASILGPEDRFHGERNIPQRAVLLFTPMPSPLASPPPPGGPLPRNSHPRVMHLPT